MNNKMFFFLLALSFFFVITGAIVGCQQKKSHEKPQFKVEYASETDEKFYQEMIGMNRHSVILFNGFPTCLTDILNASPGEEILTTETDTLFLAFQGFDQDGINNYRFYVVKDNHENFWTLSRYNENFFLAKDKKKRYKKLLDKVNKK